MKVYACPNNVTPPDFMDAFVNDRYSVEKDDELNNDFFERLKAELIRMGYTGPMTGEVVYFGYADGAAVYMVADAPRNTCLIHCPIGDAWNLPEWQTKGLTKRDIKERLAANKRLSQVFGSKP